jgi:hypothetical protein
MTLSANQQIGFPLSTTFPYPFYLYLLLRVGGDRQQSSITRHEKATYSADTGFYLCPMSTYDRT